MILSILICSIEERNQKLQRLLALLAKQATPDVEVLTSIDNKKKSVGQKRNELLDRARGQYVAFVGPNPLP